MKLMKKLFSIMTICFLLVLVVSCDVTHTHRYMDWTVTTEPTETTEGVATRECSCGEKEEYTLPVLTDTGFWTATSEEATCQKEGTITYTSEYVTVVVKQSLAEHEYTYAITTEPTLDTEGAATATCKYGETKDVTLPALTDTSVWTVKETVDSTCSVKGSKTYTSIYGDVTIELALEEHEYTYVITTEPTLDTEGAATATCKYGETKDVTLPALTDASVWTKTVVEEATYNKGGKDSYTSIYGTVTIKSAKLVAPYDNKTYYGTFFDARDFSGKYATGELTPSNSTNDTWMAEALVVSANGTANATSFPFDKDSIQFEMINPVTGEIAIKYLDSDQEEQQYKAFVDMETGIFVLYLWGNERAPFVLVPMNDKPVMEDLRAMFTASCWNSASNTAIVINYTNGDSSYNIYVDNTGVHFGVTIEDETHTALAAKDAYTSAYVYLKDAENNALGHFVNDGTSLVTSDGYEGTYQCGDDIVVISGCRTLTLNEVDGTYEISESDDYTLGLYVANTYYELTIAEDASTLVKPMVTITFVTNGFEETDPVSVNKNISYSLPVLGNETITHKFMGWYLDEDFETESVSSIIPSTSLTIYAKWNEKVIINLVNVLEGDATAIYAADGETLKEILPNYKIDSVNKMAFKGWFIDENYNTSINDNYIINSDDTGTILYAKWEELPVYYGTYYGPEIWYGGSISSSIQKLTIDENGYMTSTISSSYSAYKNVNGGKVESYNPETQEITWTDANKTNTYKFYFDENSKTIAGIYSENTIGYDYYFLSQQLDNCKPYAALGLYAPKTPEETSIVSQYAQFVEVTKNNLVFLYNNHIYSDVTLETSGGTLITSIDDLKNVNTVIVKSNDEIILKLCTIKKNFSEVNSSSNIKVLDNYYGTYTTTIEENVVVLDGAGNITYGTKSGTYTLSDNSSYDFDVYLENSTEYYRLTLNENTYTIEKPMVTYHFVTGEGHPVVEDVEYNVNITVDSLPTVADDGFAFKGWYTTDAHEVAVTSFTPTTETTLYAKWNEIFTVTVYLGDDSLESKDLEDGEYFVPIPTTVADGKLIVGYYLDSTFENKYDSTLAISATTNIYAKAMAIAPDGVISSAINGGSEKVKATNIYSWEITVNEDETINLKSTNKEVKYSNSQFVAVIEKDTIISFDYDVSSQGINSDYLAVMVKKSGKTSYETLNMFGSSTGDTGSYMTTLRAGDTLALLYYKDYWGDYGNDTAIVKNLRFTDGLPSANITYVYNDSITDNKTISVLKGNNLTDALLAAPENLRDSNAYKFDAWYLDVKLTTKATTDYVSYEDNLMLYAGWKESVVVSFVVPNGATEVEDMTVWTTEAFEAVSEKENWVFRGWYTTSDFTGDKFNLDLGVTETITLYAKFEEMPVGSNFSKANEITVDLTNNSAVIESIVTTEEFQVYYVKLIAGTTGRYNIMYDSKSKEGGTASYAYPQFAIYASDKTTIVKTSTSLYTGATWYDLEEGTYYLIIHLYSDPTKPITTTCWGTIKNLTVETFAHDEVSETVEYTLGSTVTIDTITSKNEKYILSFATTASKTYQFDFTATESSISVILYSDSTLSKQVFYTGYGKSKSEIVTLEENTTYYLEISNNWTIMGKVTISTSEFLVKDALATKVFSGDYKFYCSSSNWTATTKFTFDNNGNVVISSSSSDHDSWYGGCNDYYSPSFTGSYTYTLDGTTLTLANGTITFVFTLDNADAPTKMTLSSTTLSLSKYDFEVGTVFNLK